MTTPPPRWPTDPDPQRWLLAWVVLVALVSCLFGVVVGVAVL